MQIDIESLLQPISADDPCGPDMLLSAEFDAIQQARQHDDPSLDQGEWVIDRKEADWPFVIRECTTLLTTTSKDLRLAIWLTDAAGTTRGFAGITDGYTLLAGLCERYWEQVHPQAEDGEMDARNGNVSWLLSRTVELLQTAPLLTTPRGTVTVLAWQTAVALDQAIRRQPSEADDLQRGKVTLEALDQIRGSAPGAQVKEVSRAYEACRTAIERFREVFEARMGDEGPSFGPLMDTLENVRHLIGRFAADAGVSLTSAVATPAPVPATDAFFSEPPAVAPVRSQSGGNAAMLVQDIHTREQAILQLRYVADFFERTEPSSPAAYMARKAAKWSELPLHAWLRHVIKNDDELAQLEEMLGVTTHPRADQG